MKNPQKSLKDWSDQKWRTSDGSPSKGKKRYLPDAAWGALSPGEKAATNKAKANSCKATAPRIHDPRISSESTGNTAAKEVLIERINTWFIDTLVISP